MSDIFIFSVFSLYHTSEIWRSVKVESNHYLREITEKYQECTIKDGAWELLTRLQRVNQSKKTNKNASYLVVHSQTNKK